MLSLNAYSILYTLTRDLTVRKKESDPVDGLLSLPTKRPKLTEDFLQLMLHEIRRSIEFQERTSTSLLILVRPWLPFSCRDRARSVG